MWNLKNTTWRRKWQPTPVFLPGKSHEQRSLMGYSPQGPRHNLATKPPSHVQIHTKFSLSIHLEFCLTETPQGSDKYQNMCTLEVWGPYCRNHITKSYVLKDKSQEGFKWKTQSKPLFSPLLQNKKYNKLVNITKKKQTHRCEEQTTGYRVGRERGSIGVEEWEVQTIGYKTGHKDVLYNIGN